MARITSLCLHVCKAVDPEQLTFVGAMLLLKLGALEATL